jgi:TrmH family RNA methyltransferase
VRPITLAVRNGCDVRVLIHDAEASLSRWAADTLASVPALQVAMSPQLLAELGDKGEVPPELVAVVGLPADDLGRLPVGDGLLVVVLDRPASPGNIGTLIRSADAFGATGVVVTGHAADVYDPRAVRASTGSVFAVPVVRLASHDDVVQWVDTVRAGGLDVRLVGTDEAGAVGVADCDLTGPSVLVVGNEAAGLSAAWRAACDEIVRIPITGSASSLNAATAGAVVLYEAARQRAAAEERDR